MRVSASLFRRRSALAAILYTTSVCILLIAVFPYCTGYIIFTSTGRKRVPVDTRKAQTFKNVFERQAVPKSVAVLLSSSEKKKDWEGKRFQRRVRDFCDLSLPYFRESPKGRRLLGGLLVLTVLHSTVSVAMSYVGKDFWNALSLREPAQFQRMLYKFAACLLLGAPVEALHKFQTNRLAVEWRQWMTDQTLNLYFSNRIYYTQGAEAATTTTTDDTPEQSIIDNPDQRISEDVSSFTASSLQFLIDFITSFMDMIAFSIVLYSIMPQLFFVIIAYATIGTVVTTLLGKQLVHFNALSLQKEANLRYSLVHWRNNAESIAFFGGESWETKEVSDRVGRVMVNQRRINRAERNMGVFTTLYRYLVQLLPIGVVAPLYFSGKIQLGIVSQSACAFTHVLMDLSTIINQFGQLASFSAVVDRLSQFMNAIHNRSSAKQDEKEDSTIDLKQQLVPMSSSWKGLKGQSSNHPMLSIRNLTVKTPDGNRVLLRDVDFNLNKGGNLLIVGDSGVGKSSLLRAIAGLWTCGGGSIARPRNDEVYFLPQSPYCPVGCLRDQLLYPSNKPLETSNKKEIGSKHRNNDLPLRQSMTDEELLAILDAVDLGDLACRAGNGDPINGLAAVMDWSNTLSLGEQQRLAFGRVLVNRPRLVILDEATSALDIESEARMYQLLKEERNSCEGECWTTYISVGHRPSLLVYHEKKLRLCRSGTHEFGEIDKSSEAASIGSKSNI
eukprot:scaffold24561_cov64-Attheya_sp.AAC.6